MKLYYKARFCNSGCRTPGGLLGWAEAEYRTEAWAGACTQLFVTPDGTNTWLQDLPLANRRPAHHTQDSSREPACGFAKAGRRLSWTNARFPSMQVFVQDSCFAQVQVGSGYFPGCSPGRTRRGPFPRVKTDNAKSARSLARSLGFGAGFPGRPLCALRGGCSPERRARTRAGLSAARTAPPRSPVPREAIPRKKQEPGSLETLN